jgi:hypothetical protein
MNPENRLMQRVGGNTESNKYYPLTQKKVVDIHTREEFKQPIIKKHTNKENRGTTLETFTEFNEKINSQTASVEELNRYKKTIENYLNVFGTKKGTLKSAYKSKRHEKTFDIAQDIQNKIQYELEVKKNRVPIKTIQNITKFKSYEAAVYVKERINQYTHNHPTQNLNEIEKLGNVLFAANQKINQRRELIKDTISQITIEEDKKNEISSNLGINLNNCEFPDFKKVSVEYRSKIGKYHLTGEQTNGEQYQQEVTDKDIQYLAKEFQKDNQRSQQKYSPAILKGTSTINSNMTTGAKLEQIITPSTPDTILIQALKGTSLEGKGLPNLEKKLLTPTHYEKVDIKNRKRNDFTEKYAYITQEYEAEHGRLETKHQNDDQGFILYMKSSKFHPLIGKKKAAEAYSQRISDLLFKIEESDDQIRTIENSYQNGEKGLPNKELVYKFFGLEREKTIRRRDLLKGLFVQQKLPNMWEYKLNK